MMAGRSQAL